MNAIRRMPFALAALTLAACAPGDYAVSGSASYAGVITVASGGATVHLDALDASVSWPTVTPLATATPGPTATAPGPTATPGGEWWLAGGVDPAAVVGAYRGKGATSYADSLANLADPMTRTLVAFGADGAPFWTADTGWRGGQNRAFRMDGGVYAASDWTVIIEVAHAAVSSQQFCGFMAPLGQQPGFALSNTGAFQWVANWGEGDYGGVVTDGNIALAGKHFYRYGEPYGADVPAGDGAAEYDFYWLTANWGGAAHGGSVNTELRGMAIYDATLTAGQVGAIAAGMGGF